ncbi:MAG: TonB-dependent receptor [Vulcanimicrobiaceae bacterium]
MPRFRIRHALVAVLLLVAMLAQGTWALAGTTGGVSGSVVDASTQAPIADAKVTVSSPSETMSANTDATGHFAFISLIPDTYTVSVSKDGYAPASEGGITVFADATQTVSVSLQPALKTIAKVTSRAASSLIKSGTTADVYSVNASTQSTVQALGGGGGLNNAYSAIATVPGAYVPVGQAGWYQSVYIRGGDYDQVGYEFDGVPVNRAFDNYPSVNASALGQQELQVYTGASPANAEGQGLAGFINQVIRDGTYPGSASTDIGIGGPTYYHKMNVEVGGATPDRRFSYYVGIGGYNQDYRSYDQNNGAGISSLFGVPFDYQMPPAGAFSANPNTSGIGCDPTSAVAASYDACYNVGIYGAGPGGLILGPYNLFSLSNISDRENVVNLHFAIPHKNNPYRDDIQVLFDTSNLVSKFYSSPSDWGVPMYTNAATNGVLYNDGPCSNLPFYLNGLSPCLSNLYYGPGPNPFQATQYNGALGVALPANYASNMVPYAFMNEPNLAATGGLPIPLSERDGMQNGQSIVKLQYQHNFDASAYLRVYGYTFYSNWFLSGPNTYYSNFDGVMPADYELSTHTAGVSATFAKQLNPQNLLQLQGSYTQASVIRDNNGQILNGLQGKPLALLVDSTNPTNGLCYDASAGGPAAVATGCSGTQGGSPTEITLGEAYAGIGGPANAYAGMTCGGGPCEYLTVENGLQGTYNAVTPKFNAFSITDQWQPSAKLLFNLGLREDTFRYIGQNTQGPARAFWFNAWNQAMCVNTATPGSAPVSKGSLGLAVTAACSAAGASYSPATMTNTDASYSFNVLQPRLGATYTVDPLTVLRFSYGKYTQAPNSAFEQYTTLQQDLPDFLGPTFYAYGRTSPGYPIQPEISYNTDFSIEHQFKNTDLSFKLTPFYRKTNDQVQQFFLSQKTGFVSGLNVGNQTSKGIELEIQKGSFNRDGFSGLFSYTYTNSSVKLNTLSNGSTVVSGINQNIQNYNGYTSYCSTHTTDPRCGGNGANAAPCYTSGGVADFTCAAGSIANPYWNAPVQSLLDPNASYIPMDIFPLGINSETNSYEVPNVATLVLNYKHGKFAITPSFQYNSGGYYGAPLQNSGIDPASGCSALAGGTTSGDPRYPYGAAGGSPYNAMTCNGTLVAIPDPATGVFDKPGAFRSPQRFTMHTQLSYEVSPKATLVLTLANIIDRCWGGSKEPWTNVPGIPAGKVCNYGAVAYGTLAPVGNVYNPGATIQPEFANPYMPYFGSLPFDAYLDLKLKL